LRFHFSIIGHAKAEQEIDLVEWLEGIMAEYNRPGNPSFDWWHVIVREDVVQE
jgi:hypothetical protein